MNEKIKDALGVSIIATLVVITLSIIVGVYTFTQSVDPFSYRTFSVVGKGEINTVPDIAQLTFSVLTEGGKEVEKLQKENSEKMNGLLEKTEQRGVAKEDIKTTNYQISPRYSSFRCKFGEECPPSEIIGYTVRQTVTVKVRDFDILGALLTDAISAGVNSISGPYFKVEDEERAKSEAREEAIAEAKEKAKAMAKAGGFRLGKLLSIQERGVQPIYMAREMGEMMIAADESAPAPKIEPGSQEITASVTLTYRIK